MNKRSYGILKTALHVIGVSGLALWTSLGAAQAGTKFYCQANPANMQTYVAMYHALFMQRDTSRVAEFYHDPFITHNQDNGGGTTQQVRPKDMAGFWSQSKAEDPTRILEDELVFCVDDYVIVRTTVSGIRSKALGTDLPEPTPYTYTAMDIYRYENGKVAERWGNADKLSFFNQLGFELILKAQQTAQAED